MKDSQKKSVDSLSLEELKTLFVSYSLPRFKKQIPKINFRRIKLGSTQNIEKAFDKKNITRVLLDDNALKISNYLTIREVPEITYDIEVVNPLRKKLEELETLHQLPEVEPQFPEIQELPELKETSEESVEETPFQKPGYETKDITFNLEAQIAQEEENVIFSPGTVSLPPLEEDVISTSGEHPTLIWPPKNIGSKSGKKKEKSKVKRHKQKKGKTKPYFIREDVKKVEAEKREVKETKQERAIFPWLKQEEVSYITFEDIVQGGLEQELLEAEQTSEYQAEKEGIKRVEEVKKEEDIKEGKGVKIDASSELVKGQEKFHPKSEENLIFKAFTPAVEKDTVTDFTEKHVKSDFGIEFKGKATNMFQKINPFKIVVWGGFTITLGYVIWNYYLTDIKVDFLKEGNKKENVVVRDLFKEAQKVKKPSLQIKDKSQMVKEDKQVLPPIDVLFKPIGENERLALIQKARESLESRLDPFGQEGVLPQKEVGEKEKEEVKPPPDLQLIRKQVELVGVISTSNKDLALVNVYTADYSVMLEDDKLTRDNKLKTAFAMAVPNRIEVSILDPVEDWYIKQISKSKSRTEEPTIELVKGDKKFKLKVGQRVLLPEEKTFEELKKEIESVLNIKKEELAEAEEGGPEDEVQNPEL